MKLPIHSSVATRAGSGFRTMVSHGIAVLLMTVVSGWTQTPDSTAVPDSAAATAIATPIPSPAVPAPVAAPTAVVPAPKLKEAYSLHPLTSILIMGFSLSYERFLKPGVSLDIPVFLGLADKLYEQGRFYLGSGLGVRYYLRGAQSGGYVSPTVQVLNVSYFEDKTDPERMAGGNVLNVMAGVRYGYKYLWEHFTIDLGLGLYGLHSFGGNLGSVDSEDVTALFPMSHFALGIPF